MRKSWPFVVAVIVIGGLAGVAIAGRPEPTDTFVLDPSATVATEPLETALVSTTTTSTNAETTTSIAAATRTTVAEATTVSPTSTPPTLAPPTTTIIVGPLPRDQVRVVIANGDGRFRLASVTAERLRPLGYLVNVGNTSQVVDATIIYYRPGFDDEAAVLAVDDGVPDATLEPLPDTPVTDSDAAGDVILVLGPDAPR